MTVLAGFDGFGGSGEHLALLLLVLQNTEVTVTVLVVSVVVAVPVVTATLSVPQKEVGKRSSITFFRFRSSFGHFLVTFSDASVTFSITFCQTPFAGLLLRQGDTPLFRLNPPFSTQPPFSSS